MHQTPDLKAVTQQYYLSKLWQVMAHIEATGSWAMTI